MRTIYAFSIMSIFCFASCKKENPIESFSKIIFPSDPYELAVGFQSQLTPNGGDGKYSIKAIGDTSIVDGYSDGEVIYLTPKKYGTTILELTDSSKNTAGSVTLVVRDLVVRTTSLKIPIRGYGEIKIEGQRRNYSVTISDTTIAKLAGFSEQFPTDYRIKSVNIGKTSIAVLDSNTMSIKIIPVEVVSWPPGYVKFSTTTFNYDVTNGITDGYSYGYYSIYNNRYYEDIARIYSYRFYPDDSYDEFIISINADSLYQGLHIQYADTLSHRYLIWFVYANDSGRYQSFSGEMLFTKITNGSIAGTFSAECFYVTGSGEGTRIDSTKRLDITDGLFEINFFDDDFNKYNALKNRNAPEPIPW